MRKHLLSSFVLLIAITANAEKDKYVAKGTCGSAKVISGKTCSDVKVQMNFEGCTAKLAPQPAGRIICSGEKIKARFSDGKLRYEAQFEKRDDGWGSVEWVSTSPMAEFEPAERPRKVVTHEQPVTAPAAVPAVLPPVRAVAEEAKSSDSGTLKFSGYADLRFSSTTYKDDKATTLSPSNDSGWGIEDGAFYVNYEKGKLSLLIDVPFRRAQVKDDLLATAAPSDTDSSSKNSLLIFGSDKAQIVGRYKVTDSLTFDIGQFDTIYGVELNDSKDRVFGKTGLVYDTLLPVTHTGGMIEFSMNGYSAKAFSANPNNQGSYRNRNINSGVDDKAEYGAAVGYSNDWIHGQLGYMTRSVLATSSDYKNRTLTDVLLGGTWGPVSLDLEYGIVDDPAKNVLTTNATDKESNGTGALALLSYKVTDSWLLGLRAEQLTDAPGASASVQKAQSYGLAVHYKLDTQLELRTEYTGFNYEKTTGDKWDSSRFNVATLFYF